MSNALLRKALQTFESEETSTKSGKKTKSGKIKRKKAEADKKSAAKRTLKILKVLSAKPISQEAASRVLESYRGKLAKDQPAKLSQEEQSVFTEEDFNNGKTSLAHRLLLGLSNCKCFSQDDYYYKEDSGKLIFLPELNQFNWETLSALDMDKMTSDVQEALLKPFSIIVVEGFTILNHPPLRELFNLKYFFTLPYKECLRRRQSRIYNTPDPPSYFDLILWPHYRRHLGEVTHLKDITFLDGSIGLASLFHVIMSDVNQRIN
ncbi:unnamed protein product [Darwinula stevensoni]|uniref:Uncharacterized protein n=1 Tax=Darwinula stevensoni TaxID=69355 RepID=A0A7R8X3B4_9CRUS|nr:unnamed protein product [Darwinula stevensoni]CAG0884805.1 unnamed protein product [Darwinula stevensoni]